MDQYDDFATSQGSGVILSEVLLPENNRHDSARRSGRWQAAFCRRITSLRGVWKKAAESRQHQLGDMALTFFMPRHLCETLQTMSYLALVVIAK